MGARKREEPLTIFTIVSLVVFCISVLLYSSFGSMLSQKSFYRFVLAEDSSNVGVDWSVSANSGENEINLFWEDTFPDVLYRVAIDKGSGFGKAHPVGDSTYYTFKDLEAGKDYVLKIAAFSEDGQELSHVTIRAATEEIQEVFPGDVVINEIAWMGTSASSYDEWIELYSNTNKDLDLAGWLLVAEDGTPEIELEGQIPAGGYFLLERTDETTVSDIEADFIYTGALGNDGEHLKLVDSSGQVVDEIDCLEGWFAGDNDSKHSMERLLPEEDGSSETNWMSNDGETIFGKDVDGGKILGTPKHKNSVYGKEYVGEDAEGEEHFEGLIEEIKGQEAGSRVGSSGFVTVPLGVFSDKYFYFQDDSAGIKVDCGALEDCSVGLGNEVRIGCILKESWSEFYIKMEEGDTLEILDDGDNCPDPEEINTGDVGEDWEGSLVKVSGPIVENPSRETFYIDDGTGETKIYVKDSTGIDVPDKRTGYEVAVTGIVSQWGELKDGTPNYRVMPRFDNDLEITVPSGVVLAATKLPETAPSKEFSELAGKVFVCVGAALHLFLQSSKSS